MAIDTCMSTFVLGDPIIAAVLLPMHLHQLALVRQVLLMLLYVLQTLPTCFDDVSDDCVGCDVVMTMLAVASMMMMMIMLMTMAKIMLVMNNGGDDDDDG